MDPEPWISEVLSFWFDEIGTERWFRGDPALDALIRERFLSLHGTLAATAPSAAAGSGDRVLATLIVLDQFSRNMFRGTPRAFATDTQALAIARAAVAGGLDQELPAARRLFIYLPFEHSESLADQEQAVALMTSLGEKEQIDYAEQHRAIIARFGRFPHRNAVLGRVSTPEEIAFLSEPGSSF